MPPSARGWSRFLQLNRTTPLQIERGCLLGLVGLGCRRLSQANDHRVNTSPGDGFVDGAQGDQLPIAGGDLVSESSAEKVLIGAGQDQTFLFSDEVHHGFDFLLARAWVNRLEVNPLDGGGDYGGLEVGGFKVGVKA